MSIETGSDLISQARQEGGALIVVVAADVTVVNAPAARETLTRLINTHKPPKLVVNMEQVRYMDSSGLAVLVEVKRVLGSGDLVLTSLSKEVKGLMKIMNLHALFGFADTEADALSNAAEG